MKVLFVGSNPSRKNLKTEQPFEGTLSHRTLLAWIAELGINEYTLANVSNRLDFKSPTREELAILRSRALKYDIVVALGNNAAKALKSLSLCYIKLPHPSPRNRMLNDKPQLKRILADARTLLSDI